MADDASPIGDGDGFGTQDHLGKAEQASANIAKNLERARDAAKDMLSDLKTAAGLKINPGGGGRATSRASVKNNGNTGQSTPATTTQAKVESEAGNGADGMQGTQNAHVVTDTADDPNWKTRRQGRLNAAAALLKGGINIPLGAFNDLRVTGEQALQWEQNLLIARGGTGSFAQAKAMITGAANKYNVRDVEAFNRNMAVAFNAQWGAGFGGGTGGYQKAADAMAGMQTLASAAGLSPDAASSAAGALYSSENYYTAMAAGVMTRDPATGDMLSPAAIINQIYNLYGKGKSRAEIERGLAPGGGFAKMIQNIAGGDAGMFKSLQTGLLMAAEKGGPVSESFEAEAEKYLGTDYTQGLAGQLGYNESEVDKISEFAGVTGEGVAKAYEALTSINEAMTATGADSWLGELHTIGGGLDTLATELPNTTKAFTDMMSALLAAIPLMMAGSMASGMLGGRGGGIGGGGRFGGGGGALGGRGLWNVSVRSPSADPILGRNIGMSRGAMAANMASRALPAAAVAATGAWGINALQDMRMGSEWKWWDALGTTAGWAGTGAAAGALVGGPVGAVIGGIAGLGYGIYDSFQQKKRMDAAYQSSGVNYDTSPSYAEGSWFISKDEQANVHYGEMILPNRVAQAVRDELSRGRTDSSPSPSRAGGSPQVVINLSIQKASEREAMWLAGRVKGLIESDNELVSIGAGRFG